MTYNTRAKKAVLDFLNSNSDSWISVEEIIENNYVNVKKSTLYRILTELTDSGVSLKEYSEEKECYLYKINRSDCHSHLHLTCIDCGKYVHIEDEETESLIDKIGEKNEFVINKGKTVIYGLCEKCREKKY